MVIFINPELKVCTRVKLRSGCEAVISDDLRNSAFRMVDLGQSRLAKISNSEIESFYSLGLGWFKCNWQ
jgi:hypothetical protein